MTPFNTHTRTNSTNTHFSTHHIDALTRSTPLDCFHRPPVSVQPDSMQIRGLHLHPTLAARLSCPRSRAHVIGVHGAYPCMVRRSASEVQVGGHCHHSAYR